MRLYSAHKGQKSADNQFTEQLRKVEDRGYVTLGIGYTVSLY